MKKELKKAVRRSLKNAGCTGIEITDTATGFQVQATPPAPNTLAEIKRVQYPTTCTDAGVTYMTFVAE